MLNTRLHSKIYKLLQELDQAGSLAAILENSSFLLDLGLLNFLDLGYLDFFGSGPLLDFFGSRPLGFFGSGPLLDFLEVTI